MVDMAHSRGCGTSISKTQMRSAEARFVANRVEVALARTRAPVIPVHFHVITAGSSLVDGNIPDTQVLDSIKVLNRDFAKTGLSFKLVNTTRTWNAPWFERAARKNVEQTAMKQNLRFDGAGVLNVYSVGFKAGSGAGLLGYATFPATYELEPKNDGVVILYSSVPGGSMAPYNLGQTLTHEVGHWVGLYHTFQDGCPFDEGDGSESGDYVVDTPAQSGPSFGCPIARDSCPSDAGVDPIHNFMDYSDDECMTEFTPGQIERLFAQIAAFRGF